MTNATFQPHELSTPPDLANLMSFDETIEVELSSTFTVESDHDNSDFLSIPVPPENAVAINMVPFSYLCSITNNFAAEKLIGTGGFAKVYLGK